MPAEGPGAGILLHKVAIEQEKCSPHIQDHKAFHIYDLSGSGRGGKGREGREGSTLTKAQFTIVLEKIKQMHQKIQ